jgi:hypothetical protein
MIMNFFAREFRSPESNVLHHQTLSSSRLRTDLLYRLRWDVLSSMDEIQVIKQPNHSDSPLTPLASHLFASENVADPPISR